MSTLTVHDLRERVAAALEAIDGWKESRWAYDLLPLAEPGTYAHLAFAVGVPTVRWPDATESSLRKRGAEGGMVETDLRVRWLHRIRGDAQVADYGDAFDAEAAAYKALIGMSKVGLHLFLVSMSHRIVGDGTWMLGEIQATAIHRLPLS